MLKSIKNLLLNEKFILVIIIFNAVLLFLQESGIQNYTISILDTCCSFIFLVEMIAKVREWGWKQYWSSGWNRLDGTLVILSLPSLIAYLFPVDAMDLSILMVLRMLRVFRFFRLIHAFPGFTQMLKNFGIAMRRSYAVFVGMLIMIVIFAMIGCGLFKDVAPEYFATPLDAIYSTFRIFTGEGWNEIPDTVAEGINSGMAHIIRLYFCLILVLGCIIGMSLLNSIFVDAMVSDNNDDVKDQLDSIEATLAEIKEKLK